MQFRLFIEGSDYFLLLGFGFGLDQFHGPFHRNRQRVVGLGNRHEPAFVFDIRAETSCRSNDFLSFVSADYARQLEKLQGLFQADFFHRHAFLQAREGRFLLVLGIAFLDHRTETPQFHINFLAASRIHAKQAFPAHFLRVFGGVFHLFMERLVEVGNHLVPFHFPLGDFVELFFHIGGETVIHDGGEVFYQELVD